MLVEQQFYKSRIIPGEMVGPIAAQSIGEPAINDSKYIPLCWC